MRMHDYNKEGSKVVLLLHPMLASGKMMYELLGKHFGEHCRCLVPDFSSHGEEVGEEFESASKEASAVMDYLNQQGIDHIDLAFGASLGGVVLLNLLKFQNITFGHIYFEGTSFFEHTPILTGIIQAKFIKKHRRASADRARAVTVMGKLYGKDFAEDFADQFIGMSENSIKNVAYSCGNNELPELNDDEQKICTFAYGSKDFNISKAKRGCKKYYPNAKFILWEGFGHCEKITANTDAYIKILKEYLK